MDVFSLTGKIAVEYSDAVNGLKKVSETANEAGNTTEKTENKIVTAFKKIGTAIVEGFKKQPIEETKESLSDLSEKIRKQESDLSALKSKYQDLYLTHGKNSDEAKECAQQIKELSSELKDNKSKVDEAEQAADDLDESLKNVDESAQNAGDGFTIWKGVIANLVSSAITSLISKCAELAGKMADLTKSAVGNYAEYEQLVGGVETLFKGSSDQLIEYAEGAYKTAGLSANEYMDTATSFAASLIQGLGGDTAKAVELTNLAITDMSDNANKMGTDMSSIQDAYQGFAKQNYTMLDNLKLGYGGTQEEMIRLINDSGILNEEISSLDGITFDQMIEAIHAIQSNLGITGTTAEEAGSTISGSWGSVQALFQNILTKVGSELAPTVMGFLSQLSEWMESIDWDAFAETIGNAFGEALEWIQQIDFESFFQAGIEGVTSFIEGLANLVIGVQDAITWMSEHKSLMEGIAAVIGVVVAALAGFSIFNTVATFISNAKTAFAALNAVMSANPVGAVITIISLLVTTLITLWNTNEGFRNAVLNLWEAIKTGIGNALEAIKNIITTVWGAIKTIVTTVMDAIKTVFSTGWNAIKTVFSTVWNAIKTTVSTVINAISSTISSVFNAIKNTISNVLNSVKSTFSNVWNGIKSTVSSVINGIKSTISSGINAAKSTVSSVLDSIKSKFSSIFEGAKTIVSNAIDKIKGFFNFSWSLPSIKLPHFSISGSFSLNPPSIPHFSVEWYKKAMEDGMIMNEPTIFGYSAKNNRLLAGGEAGSETVVGTQNLMDMIHAAASDGNERVIALLDRIIELIEQGFPDVLAALTDQCMVLDDGTLVAKIAPQMNRELGIITAKRGRGR